jgi:hypothetical protein
VGEQRSRSATSSMVRPCWLRSSRSRFPSSRCRTVGPVAVTTLAPLLKAAIHLYAISLTCLRPLLGPSAPRYGHRHVIAIPHAVNSFSIRIVTFGHQRSDIRAAQISNLSQVSLKQASGNTGAIPGTGDCERKASGLHSVECPCLHPGEEIMPLVTTQSDGRASRIGGTTDHHSVTDCRNFDTRSAFARQTFVPHRFASQPVTHTTPKRRWVKLSDPSETRGLNLCQTKDPHHVPYVRSEASDTNVTTVRS